MLHTLIVVALLGYLWFLVRLAKPTISKPVTISRASLWIQTIIAWLFTLLFGLLTLAIMVGNITRQSLSATAGNALLGLLVWDLGVPLLFALSLRWSRRLMQNRIFVREVNG